MLDLAFVRANVGLAQERLRLRGDGAARLLQGFSQLDARRRSAITQVETLKAERNRVSEEVARRKKAGEDAEPLVEQNRTLKADIEALEGAAAAAEQEMQLMLEQVPNLPHESVPPGTSADDNVEVKRWGTLPEFTFAPKPHEDVAEALGILDFARAAKISGARFAVYMGNGARLERALSAFMLDVHTREHGYTEVLPPVLVNRASLFGTGQLPKFREDLFKCEGSDHWLIPTAEVPLTNLYRDEILEEGRLPVSLTACTPCFRSEAGSYGRDTKGLIRQHQFQKVELVKLVNPQQSYGELESLTRDAERILELLKLPYRRMLLCAGDMGFSAAKTYDLEVWLPGQGAYREISSCSNTEAFQARRANIRFRAAGKGKSELVHTLNGSGLAIGRTWLAIVENYQQVDGTVRIPEVLVPYMDGTTVLEPVNQ